MSRSEGKRTESGSIPFVQLAASRHRIPPELWCAHDEQMIDVRLRHTCVDRLAPAPCGRLFVECRGLAGILCRSHSWRSPSVTGCPAGICRGRGGWFSARGQLSGIFRALAKSRGGAAEQATQSREGRLRDLLARWRVLASGVASWLFLVGNDNGPKGVGRSLTADATLRAFGGMTCVT
jgi:hypothetical protein